MVAAAYQLATGPQRHQLSQLMTAAQLSQSDITRWQTLIADIGTVEWIEELIDRRLTWALRRLDAATLNHDVRAALGAMAAACTERVA